MNPFERLTDSRESTNEGRVLLLDKQIDAMLEDFKIVLAGLEHKDATDDVYQEPLKLRTLRKLTGKPLPRLSPLKKTIVTDAQRGEMARLALEYGYKLEDLLYQRAWLMGDADFSSAQRIQRKTIDKLRGSALGYEQIADTEKRLERHLNDILASEDPKEQDFQLAQSVHDLDTLEKYLLAKKLIASKNYRLIDQNLELFDDRTRAEFGFYKNRYLSTEETKAINLRDSAYLDLFLYHRWLLARSFMLHIVESLNAEDPRLIQLAKKYFKSKADLLITKRIKTGLISNAITASKESIFNTKFSEQYNEKPESDNFDEVKIPLYLALIQEYTKALQKNLDTPIMDGQPTASILAREIIDKIIIVAPLIDKGQARSLASWIEDTCQELLDWKRPTYLYVSFEKPNEAALALAEAIK